MQLNEEKLNPFDLTPKASEWGRYFMNNYPFTHDELSNDLLYSWLGINHDGNPTNEYNKDIMEFFLFCFTYYDKLKGRSSKRFSTEVFQKAFETWRGLLFTIFSLKNQGVELEPIDLFDFDNYHQYDERFEFNIKGKK